MAQSEEKESNPQEDLETKRSNIAVQERIIDSELKDSKKAVQDTRRELYALKNDVEIASRILNNAYKLLDFSSLLIPVVTVAIVIAYLGLSLNTLLLSLLATALPLFLILRLVVLVVRIQLRDKNTPFASSVKESLG